MQRRVYNYNPPAQFLEKPILNLKEAAGYLKRSERFVRDFALSGAIPCQKFQRGKSGRYTYFFTREALDRWAGGESHE